MLELKIDCNLPVFDLGPSLESILLLFSKFKNVFKLIFFFYQALVCEGGFCVSQESMSDTVKTDANTISAVVHNDNNSSDTKTTVLISSCASITLSKIGEAAVKGTSLPQFLSCIQFLKHFTVYKKTAKLFNNNIDSL